MDRRKSKKGSVKAFQRVKLDLPALRAALLRHHYGEEIAPQQIRQMKRLGWVSRWSEEITVKGYGQIGV